MTGEDEWTLLLEDLLRGLVHAMNNRVTALSAFAEMAAMDNETLDVDMLRHEINRLHAVSSMVGVLALRSSEREALELSGVLDVALNVHSHHPRIRSLPCIVEKTGAVLPVRVPRWALLRLALLMVDAAKRAGIAADADTVTVRLSGDDAIVRVRVVSTKPLGAYAMSLAALCGGELGYANGEALLELPSLLEVRRREKTAG
jgi:hypothetical protein